MSIKLSKAFINSVKKYMEKQKKISSHIPLRLRFIKEHSLYKLKSPIYYSGVYYTIHIKVNTEVGYECLLLNVDHPTPVKISTSPTLLKAKLKAKDLLKSIGIPFEKEVRCGTKE